MNGPLNILVVDDVKDNTDLIEHYLKGYSGLNLTKASSGAEAIEKFQKNTFNLILMDIQMPLMDGNEAVRKIREIESEKKMNKSIIVMLSAHAISSEIENSKKAGCDGYITKPIKKKIFLDAIDSFLKNESKETWVKKVS